jgi:hypothetical protein
MTTKKNIKDKKNTKKNSKKFTYKKKGGDWMKPWTWFTKKTPEEKRDECIKKCSDTYNKEKEKEKKDDELKQKKDDEQKQTLSIMPSEPVNKSTAPEPERQQPQPQPQNIGMGGKKYNKKRTNKYKKNENIANSF